MCECYYGFDNKMKTNENKTCKCKSDLVMLNFGDNTSKCPICKLPKKLKSERCKNMLKFGYKLNQKVKK